MSETSAKNQDIFVESLFGFHTRQPLVQMTLGQARVQMSPQEARDVRNILLLPRRGPDPGKGWGCFQCHLPMDGATAVVCDACLVSGADIREVIAGYATDKRRAPVDSLTPEPFEHDMALHPGVE